METPNSTYVVATLRNNGHGNASRDVPVDSLQLYPVLTVPTQRGRPGLLYLDCWFITEVIYPPTSYQVRFREGAGGGAPSKNSAPPRGPPMQFMIKHNLPLVRGGSLWQYRSVSPAAIMAIPLAPKM